MAYSVLVGPSVDQTTTLTESEYGTLKNALLLARAWKGHGKGEDDREARAIAYALRGCDDALREGRTLGVFLDHLMSWLGEHVDEMQGMLWGRDLEAPVFMREEEGAEHVAALKAFSRILRSDGWLAGFLFTGRLERWAEKSPTPLEVMQALTEEAVHFECNIHDAKRLVREWPEFFPTQAAASVEHGGTNGTVEAKPPDDETGYVLNEYDSKGNLAKAVWMSRGQYGEVKKTLLEQGCEVVDEKADAKAAGTE